MFVTGLFGEIDSTKVNLANRTAMQAIPFVQVSLVTDWTFPRRLSAFITQAGLFLDGRVLTWPLVPLLTLSCLSLRRSPSSKEMGESEFRIHFPRPSLETVSVFVWQVSGIHNRYWIYFALKNMSTLILFWNSMFPWGTWHFLAFPSTYHCQWAGEWLIVSDWRQILHLRAC